MFNKIHQFLYKRFRRVKNKAYGYIYLPQYEHKHKIKTISSNLYNEYGEKLDEFFLRGNIFCDPQRLSRYFVFDRYNFALKTHFYAHRSMLETFGEPEKRFGLLIEPPTILPKAYNMFDKFKGIEKDFDGIFTYHAPFLEKFDNAKFVPLYASTYGCEFVEDSWYKNKTQNVSILSSNKQMCKMHKYRYSVAMLCKENNLCDTFGTFDGGQPVRLQDTIRDYRFSIQIENFIAPYYFTERIIAPFSQQTIPIYFGATEIDQFFNPDGIIKITKNSDIEKVIKSCTKEEYESRIPAILDNYERAKQYANSWDYLYLKYFKNKGNRGNVE